MQSTPVQGSPYNTIGLSFADGVVSVVIRWDWDGTSTAPYEGSVVDVSVSNTDTTAWTATFPYRQGEKTLVIAAGSSRTYSGGQLNSLGMSAISAARGALLVRG